MERICWKVPSRYLRVVTSESRLANRIPFYLFLCFRDRFKLSNENVIFVVEFICPLIFLANELTRQKKEERSFAPCVGLFYRSVVFAGVFVDRSHSNDPFLLFRTIGLSRTLFFDRRSIRVSFLPISLLLSRCLSRFYKSSDNGLSNKMNVR